MELAAHSVETVVVSIDETGMRMVNRVGVGVGVRVHLGIGPGARRRPPSRCRTSSRHRT